MEGSPEFRRAAPWGCPLRTTYRTPRRSWSATKKRGNRGLRFVEPTAPPTRRAGAKRKAPGSGRVVAAGVPGVTAADARHPPARAPQRAVLLDRADEVLAAARREAA